MEEYYKHSTHVQHVYVATISVQYIPDQHWKHLYRILSSYNVVYRLSCDELPFVVVFHHPRLVK